MVAVSGLTAMWLFLTALVTIVAGQQADCSATKTTVYNFTAPALDGSRNISLSEYKGKPFIVINTATYWGNNRLNFLGLNALLAKVEAHVGKGRMGVVAFPSNVFGLQEPGANAELLNGLKYVRPGGGYVPNFPLTQKFDVNGANEHPLFTSLKASCPAPVPFMADRAGIFWTPVKASDISWNFEKFLIDSAGHAYRRYSPGVDPLSMYGDVVGLIEKQLNKTKH